LDGPGHGWRKSHLGTTCLGPRHAWCELSWERTAVVHVRERVALGSAPEPSPPSVRSIVRLIHALGGPISPPARTRACSGRSAVAAGVNLELINQPKRTEAAGLPLNSSATTPVRRGADLAQYRGRGRCGPRRRARRLLGGHALATRVDAPGSLSSGAAPPGISVRKCRKSGLAGCPRASLANGLRSGPLGRHGGAAEAPLARSAPPSSREGFAGSRRMEGSEPAALGRSDNGGRDGSGMAWPTQLRSLRSDALKLRARASLAIDWRRAI
jgi:hypothetical protein